MQVHPLPEARGRNILSRHVLPDSPGCLRTWGNCRLRSFPGQYSCKVQCWKPLPRYWTARPRKCGKAHLFRPVRYDISRADRRGGYRRTAVKRVPYHCRRMRWPYLKAPACAVVDNLRRRYPESYAHIVQTGKMSGIETLFEIREIPVLPAAPSHLRQSAQTGEQLVLHKSRRPCHQLGPKTGLHPCYKGAVGRASSQNFISSSE